MTETKPILVVASRGSKLSLDLYSFAASYQSATSDASSLAKAVIDLSRALWHVATSQKEDARITTRDARETIVDIVQQCELAFSEVEAVVPLEMLKEGNAITFGQKWEWNEVARAKIHYLLGHLESLRLTLDVMAQTIRIVKVMEWSIFQPPNPLTVEAVSMERMQLESLVVEQQLSFLRAGQLFDTLHQRHAESTFELIPQDDSMQVMTLFEEHAPNPSRLMRYQESTLSNIRSSNETEKLALVRRASSPYIEYLLERWTRLQEIRRMQQPRVDSDESSDEDDAPSYTHSNGISSPIGPVLSHVDEHLPEPVPRNDPSSPIPVPVPVPERVRRSYGPSPTSPQVPQASSWAGRSPSYFSAQPVKPPASAGTSPRSPYAPIPTHFPPPTSVPRSVPSPMSNAPQVVSPAPSVAQPVKPKIPWRLRLGDKYWDFENEKTIGSNTPLDPSQVQEDRHVSTDILAKFVTQEAIEDMKYRYDRVSTDINDGRRTKLETLFCIRQALTFAEVDALVLRTQQRFEQRYKKPRPSPHLDRAVSMPLPQPGLYLQTPTDYRRSSSRRSRDYDDYDRARSTRSSPSHDSDTDTDRSTERKHSRRNSNSSNRSGGSFASKPSKTVKNMRNVAAGAGFAALLEGVVEGLGAI